MSLNFSNTAGIREDVRNAFMLVKAPKTPAIKRTSQLDPSKPYLLQMPAEVRLRIYELALGPQPARWSGYLHMKKTDFALLRVNRQIYIEARSELEKNAIYHLTIRGHNKFHFRGKKYETLDELDLPGLLRSGVLRFRIHIHFSTNGDENKMWKAHDTHYRNTLAALKWQLNRLAAILNASPRRLKHLGIDLWADEENSMIHNAFQVKWLTRPFHCLRNIQSVQFKMRTYFGRTRPGILTHSRSCRNRLYGIPCFCPDFSLQCPAIGGHLNSTIKSKMMGNSPVHNAPLVAQYTRFLNIKNAIGREDFMLSLDRKKVGEFCNDIWHAADAGDSVKFEESMRELSSSE